MSLDIGYQTVRIFKRIDVNNNVLFTDATWEDFLTKAVKEIEEIKAAPKSKRLVEHADAFICLIGAAAKDGCTLHQLLTAVEHKLDVNDRRTFVRQPDGTYQHVEGK